MEYASEVGVAVVKATCKFDVHESCFMISVGSYRQCCWQTFHWPLYPKLVPENRNRITYYRLCLTAELTELFFFVIRHVLHRFPTTGPLYSLSCGQEIPHILYNTNVLYVNKNQPLAT
jgi:hypothetical protein